MHLDDFRGMYNAELQEARSLEAQLVNALPKMADAAENQALSDAFRMHLEETRGHQRGVEGILKKLGVSATEHDDQSMHTLIDETAKMIDMTDRGPIRDAALIASAQRVEHYEIAVYGTLATYAKWLGRDDDKQTLADIMEEEKNADEKLSELADGTINPTAAAQAA
jgi:ferritin-like metal-binding protein YciE